MQLPTHPAQRAAATAIGALLLAGVLGGCAPTPQSYACGTIETPPVSVDAARCPADRTDTTVSATGARWYAAPTDDVSKPDEIPVVGQPLDGDWWDPVDRADKSDGGGSTPKPKATKTKSAKSTR